MKNTVNNMPVTPGSGGGSRGGWLGHIFGMLRGVKMEELSRNRYAWQQSYLTEEMKKRDINRASAQTAGKVVGEDMRQKNNAKNAFAFEKKRTSKDKKTGEYKYPDLFDMGPAEDPLNARWSPRSGERAANARAAAAAAKAEQDKNAPKFTPADVSNFPSISLADEPQADFSTGPEPAQKERWPGYGPTFDGQGNNTMDTPGSPNPSTPDLNTNKPSAATPKAKKPRKPRAPKAGA